MLRCHFPADTVHAALDASLEFHRNGLGRTVVIHLISAEHSAGKSWRGLGRLHHCNYLLVSQFFGTIVVMAVPVMEPASLELNEIVTSHNSHTVLATGPTAQRTTINVVFDSAFVCMRARELPSSKIGIESPKSIKLFLAGKLQVLAHNLIKFSLNSSVI